uniref:Stabilin 1 n=1 Tax=Apteryx owenii TaxID=8824 RepID=A0A8B9S3J3_APTOW
VRMTFTLNTACTACAAAPKMLCPRGWIKTTQGLGVRDCRYTVKLGENTLSQPGCHHICKKEIEEKKCCPGFWGTECYECPGGSENPCSGHGMCLDGIQRNGTCICKEQYSGFTCQNCRDENHFGPDCQSVCDCVHGECNSGVTGNGSCTCYGGYTGPRCDQELPLCKGVICEADSQCVVKDGTAMCDCKPGYRKSGTTCQVEDPCASSPCSPSAVCKVLGPGKYECTCKGGFQGDGKICQPINPCVDNNGGCPENSTLCVYKSPGEVSAITTCQQHVSENSQVRISCNEAHDHTGQTCYPHFKFCNCVCKEGEIGDGRSCYKDLMSEINQQNVRGRFVRKLNVNCGLPAILDGPGPFTVFVPSNDGVDRLRDGRLIYLFTEVRAHNNLRSLKSSVTVEKLIMMPYIVTMANQILTINISTDGRILMDESGIPINMRNIMASNGIIHTLDGIFIPPSIVPILPHRCNEEQHKIVTGSCVDCEALNNSVCPPNSTEMEPTLSPKECVYIHDPQGLNVLKKGCARYCNQTVTKLGCCKGFFGPDCMPCPGGFSSPCYGRGNCSDGIQGNGNCQCFDGFKGIACHICSNPNKHGENCDEDCGCVHGVCDNRPGSGGVCQSWSCKEGYTGKFCDKTSKNCGPSGLSQYCHQNAVCSLNDTARCICMDGYEGDGFSCQPIDLCGQPERGGCSQNVSGLVPGPGTAICQCNKGWTGDGKACVAIDNCVLESRGDCHINANCVYIGPGQSKCVCKRGYAGDGHSCDAINPCLLDNGGCHDLAMCEPLGGGERSCTCPQDYLGDGMTCYGDILKVSKEQIWPGKKQLTAFFLSMHERWALRSYLPLITNGALICSLPACVPFRAHFLEGVFTGEELRKYKRPELPTLSPQTRWQINTKSDVRISYVIYTYQYQIKLLKSCLQYHVVLGEKLFPTDLRSGIHKNTMLGFSYWLMFYQNSTQKFVNNIPLDGKFFETKNGMLIGVSQVLQIQKNRCTANTTTIQKVMMFTNKLTTISQAFSSSQTRSVCCPGYYGHMCEMCPGKPGQWCSGNGECQDGIEGSGECRCLEGFHGTACEMCEVGRYGADCKTECACDNGICNDGLQGDGSCECFPGPWCNIAFLLILLLLFLVTEIDPCTIDHGGCSIHAVCTKVSPGERTCVCKEGYAGDGTLCMGELSVLVLVMVSGIQTEHLSSLQVACNCLPGYSGDGVSRCNPINLCEQNNGGCSPFGLCKYTGPGTRNCSCSWHSVGDGFTCHGKVYQVRSMHGVFCLQATCPTANHSPHSKGLLRELLRYHMVGCQKLLSSDLEAQESLTSLSGHKIKIAMKENSIYLNEEATVVVGDIIGMNGVIHFINKILIPSDLVDHNISSKISQQNITEVAEAFGYTIYSQLLKDAELLPLVNDPLHRPFTMLWPTDAAFNALSEKRQQWLYRREHRDVLASYLKAHMIRDIVAGNVLQLESLRTMHGSAVLFSCSKTQIGELLVGNGDAVIIQRHMEFNGGIAYGIDRLLEPPDLGSRCDEFISVELQVSTYDVADEDLCHLSIPVPGKMDVGRAYCSSSAKLQAPFRRHFSSRGPLKRGCKRSCISTQWVPQCCVNHYGRDCRACPGGLEAPCSNRGTCDDKIGGSGRCNCTQAFIGTSCELCAPGRYGPHCRGKGEACGVVAVQRVSKEVIEAHSAVWRVTTPICSPPCHPQATCRSGNLCECNLHYEGDGRMCSVIDMCSPDNGGCARHAHCTQVGVNVSCACAPGYQGDGYVCDPIDRCMDGRNGDCSQHANCISTGPNERRCECKQGFVGNGIQCLEEAVPPMDRCLEENGQCHREAICTDLHFHDKTVGVFHLQSFRKKYDFTYEQAQKACAAEGASLATFRQLSAAQQVRTGVQRSDRSQLHSFVG